MKKILIITICILAAICGYSQTEKGKMFVGGSFSLSDAKNSDLYEYNTQNSNSSYFQISPNFGYFIMNNFAVGVNISYSLSTQTNVQTNPIGSIPADLTTKSTNNGYGGGFFARYYKRVTPSLLFFANGSLSYTYSLSKQDRSTTDKLYAFSNSNPSEEEIHTSSGILIFTPGIVYFVSPHLGIEGTFGNIYYTYSTNNSNRIAPFNQSRSASSFNINFRTSFSLAFNYYF